MILACLAVLEALILLAKPSVAQHRESRSRHTEGQNEINLTTEKLLNSTFRTGEHTF